MYKVCRLFEYDKKYSGSFQGTIWRADACHWPIRLLTLAFCRILTQNQSDPDRQLLIPDKHPSIAITLTGRWDLLVSLTQKRTTMSGKNPRNPYSFNQFFGRVARIQGNAGGRRAGGTKKAKKEVASPPLPVNHFDLKVWRKASAHITVVAW